MRSGPGRTGKSRSGKTYRTVQIRCGLFTGQDRTGGDRIGQAMPSQVRSGRDGKGQVRSGLEK